MSDEWKGDGKYVLPLQRVEPYRLWFEFLKLALKDDDIPVDREFYRDWGDVEGQTFTQWWAGETWRTLFAIENEVRVLDANIDSLQSNAPVSTLDVRIPLGKPLKDSLEDIKHLLEEHGASVRLDKAPKGRFSLTPDNVDKGFLKHMRNARMNLRLYGYWLSHQGKDNQVQLASVDWYHWAVDRNHQIETKGWRYEKVFIPIPFQNWCGFLDDPQDDKWGETRLNDKGKQVFINDPEIARRQVMRYLKKASNLARNVGKGVFPGTY